MRMKRFGLWTVLVAIVWVGDGSQAMAAERGTPPRLTVPQSATVVLDTASFWRVRTVWETKELTLPSGEVQHARIGGNTGAYFQKNMDKIEAPDTAYKIEKVNTVRLPSETAADWFKAEFDDSTWARLRGPLLDKSIKEEWKLILMRGLFEVTDPAKAAEGAALTLSLVFRGGAVVYLNGEELARSAMPKGDIDLYTPGDGYPADAYFTSEGFTFLRQDRSADVTPRLAQRSRQLTDVKIPPGKLKKGVNVLAVAIHRAPTLAAVHLRHNKGSYTNHDDIVWAKIGLAELQLIAGAGAAVVPNVGLVKGRGFKVWNQSVVQSVLLPDYPDAFAPLSPIRMTGSRNGMFAGQVVVGDDQPIKGLKAEVSDLAGPGTIPAAGVRVRYGRPDGRGPVVFFDSLDDDPPGEVPVYKEHGGAVQPIWITVSVPADAKPGDYVATVTVKADGVKAWSVPLNLRVIDWALPAVEKYTATMDVIESPESVALAYDVPMWSQEHFKLLDKVFTLLGEVGAKTIFISCIRRTHFGNEHAMVRWIRSEDGETLSPDFSVVEKYLDVAVKHLGKVPGVILYCWEPPESQGHAGGAGSASRTYDKPILITVVDPKTGKLSARQGPAWGSPEAKVFWKKLTDGIQPVLKKRGLENSMLFGLIGDTRPTKQAMADISTGVPDGKWAVHSHYYCDEWNGHKIGYAIALWGIGVWPIDPTEGYSFGWTNSFWLAYFPREMHIDATLVEHRVKLENWMAGKRSYTPFISKGVGPRGLGRIGGDFWDVVKDEKGRIRGNIAGQYPESAWGQLNLNNCEPYILGKGAKGPLATVRSEALREGLQEVEGRIYIEKALLDDGAKTLLGDDLLARCRKALDERIRMCMHSEGEGQPWFISSGWNARSELLFSLAAEVARKYGGKEPNPNLVPEPVKKN